MSVDADSVANYDNLYDGMYDQLLAKLNAGLQNDRPISSADDQLNGIIQDFRLLVDKNLTEGRQVELDDYVELSKSIQNLRVELALAEYVTDKPTAMLMMNQFPWIDLLVTAWSNWQFEVKGIAPTADIIYTALMGIYGVSKGALEKASVRCSKWQARLECKQIGELLETNHTKYSQSAPAARKEFAENNGLQPITYEDGNDELFVVWPTLKQMQRMLSEGIEKIDKDGGVVAWKSVLEKDD